DLDAKLGQQLLADRADGDAHGRFTSAGTFERYTQLAVAVLDRACQVGVTWARRRHGGDVLLAPVLEVAVLNLQRNRRTGRDTRHHAGRDLDGVALDVHAPARAVADLTAG